MESAMGSIGIRGRSTAPQKAHSALYNRSRSFGPTYSSRQAKTKAVLRASGGGESDEPVKLQGDALHKGRVVTLGNLCVDVFARVGQLPQPENKERVLSELRAAGAPDTEWEAGGASNFAIAATRLGLPCSCLGHTADDMYGEFLLKVLESEGVDTYQVTSVKGRNDGHEPGNDPSTLVCWVLFDGEGHHDFVSRFDFTTEPLLKHLSPLPAEAKEVLASSGAIKVNGFVFDELLPSVVETEIVHAREQHGIPIFFDTGPRSTYLKDDVPEGGENALWTLLRRSDVLLLTQKEAEIITGEEAPDRAALQLLNWSKRSDPWVIVKLGRQGSLLASNRAGIVHSEGFQVDVEDEVGCGDSFAAAVCLAHRRKAGPETALVLGNAVGAATATRVGAGRSVASSGRVLRLLESRIARGRSHDQREAARNAVSLLEASLASPAGR